MINWKTLVITSALVTLPLGAYAVQSHQENNIQESTNMRHFAQRNNQGKRGGKSQKFDKLMQQLNLTPEQSQQVEAIQEESREIAEDLEQQMRSQREDMKSLMTSDAEQKSYAHNIKKPNHYTRNWAIIALKPCFGYVRS